MIIGIKNLIIMPRAELSITDILVASIDLVSSLYAISIKDDNVMAKETIHPR